MEERPRIYLAGPEVFLPDPLAAARAKQALCEAAGLEGVFPLDAALDLEGLPPFEQARRISLANEGLMRSCDALIANLTPFRGVSMDAGTAFEVGFMRALGRPVLGYSNVPLDFRRRSEIFRAAPRLPFDGDFAGVSIEDFGLVENLMIAIAITESGGSVVTAAVEPGRELTDLSGFAGSLDEAVRLLAAQPST